MQVHAICYLICCYLNISLCCFSPGNNEISAEGCLPASLQNIEFFAINSRILSNRSCFDSLLKIIHVISSKGDGIGIEINNHFSLYKIVEQTNHMVFQEELFAILV